MKIQVGEGEAIVTFQHVRFSGVDGQRSYTTADITIQDRPCGHGTAWCSRKDQFCKRTGRRIALTRAIAALPTEIRRAVWTGLQAKGMRLF